MNEAVTKMYNLKSDVTPRNYRYVEEMVSPFQKSLVSITIDLSNFVKKKKRFSPINSYIYTILINTK